MAIQIIVMDEKATEQALNLVGFVVVVLHLQKTHVLSVALAIIKIMLLILQHVLHNVEMDSE